MLQFSKPVEWDGWYFETSKQICSLHDPVRFSIHSVQNGEWVVVGSSAYIQAISGIALLHKYYSTSTQRGFKERFDMFRSNELVNLVANIVGGFWLLVGLSGSLGIEHHASLIYQGHSVVRILVALSLVVDSVRRGQHSMTIYYCFSGLAHLGILLLARREQWFASVMLTGTCLLSLGIYLYPFDFYGSRSAVVFLRLGGTMLGTGLATQFLRRRAAAAAVALVERDRRAYDELWAGLSRSLGPECARLNAAVDTLQREIRCEGRAAEQACTGGGGGGGGGGGEGGGGLGGGPTQALLDADRRPAGSRQRRSPSWRR